MGEEKNINQNPKLKPDAVLKSPFKPFLWRFGNIPNQGEIDVETSGLEKMSEYYDFEGQADKNGGNVKKEYVTREAIVSCSLGTRYTKLDLCVDHGIIAANKKPLMTCEDCHINENVFRFDMCNGAPSSSNAHCVPILGKRWLQKAADLNASDGAKEKYVEALRSDAYLGCFYGGVITIKEIPMKGEPNVIPDNGRIITFPDIVNGELNGVKKVLKPNLYWYNFRGNAIPTVEIENKTYYKIAVGPKLLDPQYSDDSHIYDTDFKNWGSIRIDVHLRLKEDIEGIKLLDDEILESHKVIECIVKDAKAHSYNLHPDKTPGHTHKIFEYNKNITASFEIENGLIQTGIAYPNSTNGQKDDPDDGPIAVNHMDSSVIEFFGRDLGFTPGCYYLEMVVVYDE